MQIQLQRLVNGYVNYFPHFRQSRAALADQQASPKAQFLFLSQVVPGWLFR